MTGKARWVAGYTLAAVAPLIAALALSDLPGRTFLLELGSALGIVALTLLALQLVLPSRLRAVEGGAERAQSSLSEQARATPDPS